MLGDVGEPHTIGSVGNESALHQIQMSRWPGLPATALAAVTDPLQTSHTHEASHPFAADRESQTEAKFGMDPRRAVSAAGLLMNLSDGLDHRFVLDLTI